MYNSIYKTILCSLLLLNTLSSHAQSDSVYLKGCWVEVCTGMVYERINGTMQQTSSGIKGNEMRRMLLLCDNKGAFFMPSQHNAIKDEDKFLWSADSCKFLFQESEDCPYTRASYYTISSSDNADTLHFDYRYKNPNYITKSLYVRDRVKLESDNIATNCKINRTDKYNAYHHRIITDQIPFVYNGTYNQETLTLDRRVCKYLQKMTQSDQVEIHVFESKPHEHQIIYIYIITYNPTTKVIDNISFIDSYIKK